MSSGVSTGSTAADAALEQDLPPLLETHDLELVLGSGPTLSREGALVLRQSRLLCVGAASALVHFATGGATLRRGTLSIRGQSPSELLASGRAGYFPRELPAPAEFTVMSALLGSARLIGLGQSDVKRALERTEAEGLGRRQLKELGPLQRRLVGLAHGLTSEPELVLLEDPFLDLEDDDAEFVLSVIERELEGRAWIGCSDLDSPWSRRFAALAELGLTAEGGDLLGPMAPLELTSSGAWARFDRIDELLLQGLGARGAEVVQTPSQNVILVRRLGGLAIAEVAAQVGVSLLELTPLAP